MTLQGRVLPEQIDIPMFLELLTEFTNEFAFIRWKLDGQNIAFEHNMYMFSPLKALFSKGRPPMSDEDMYKIIQATTNQPNHDPELRKALLKACKLEVG